ncbi:MAG TPA: ClpXP protease specificity-enhancing factor [Methylophilus sp.]
MSELISTKPYMVRAMHEWCVDNGLTPHLLVAVNQHTRVPMGFVKDGEIVLNLNYTATKDLHMDNDAIVFSARFGGVAHNIYVPLEAVKGIFARENGQGMFFEVQEMPLQAADAPADSSASLVQDETAPTLPSKGKPSLKIVK